MAETAQAARFLLGPRSAWNPTASTLFLFACAFVPTVLFGMLLRPVHPLLGVLLGLSILVVAAVWPRLEVMVGEDGLSIGQRFVPWREVESACRGSYFGRGIASVVFSLSSGEQIELWCMVEMGDRILEAAWAAKARYDAAPHEVEAAELARRGRDAAAWVRDLRSMGTGARSTHRTAAVRDDVLWRTALEPGADPGVRAAAAVALGPVLDDDGRTRLRVAAAATASPRLRIAIERVLEDADEASLAEALAEAERDAAKRDAPAMARLDP